MYSSTHEENHFADLVQQGQQADDQALASDPNVSSARRAVEQAQADLSNLQAYLASIPSPDRFQYQGNLDAAFQAIEQAKQAELQAQNTFWRGRHAAARAQANAERDAALEAERQQLAQAREQQEKQDFKLAWIAANGSAEGCETAWKAHIDAERLKRADAAQQELKQSLHRQVGYPGF